MTPPCSPGWGRRPRPELAFRWLFNTIVEDRIFQKRRGHRTTRGRVGTGPRAGCSSLAHAGRACGWAWKEGPPPLQVPGLSRAEPWLVACEALKWCLVHRAEAAGGRAGDTCGSEQRRDGLGDSPGCPACLMLPHLARELHGDQRRPGRRQLSRAGLGVSPQTAALEDQDEDDEDDDFVEVPEKEGYEACVPAHLWPEDGEQRGGGFGRVLLGTPPRGCGLTSRAVAGEGGMVPRSGPWWRWSVTLLLCPGHSLAWALPKAHPAGDSCCPSARQALLPAPVGAASEGPQLATQAPGPCLSHAPAVRPRSRPPVPRPGQWQRAGKAA